MSEIQIASFDIGIKNFAYYIEKCDPTALKENVYDGCVVEMNVVDLTSVCENDDTVRQALISTLNSLKEKLMSVSTVLLEQQYFNTYVKNRKRSGTQANIKAIKICENVAMWFNMTFPEKKVVIFPSFNKTRSLGAPPDLTKPQRKKWTVEKMFEILDARKDAMSIEFLRKKKKMEKQKLDDIADAMMQCQAYKLTL